MPYFVFLWTDIFVHLMVLTLLVYGFRITRRASLRSAWASVARTPSAMCAAVVLLFFLLIGVLDSIHYRPLLPPLATSQGVSASHEDPAVDEGKRISDDALADVSGASPSTPVYSPVLRSALDDLLSLTQLPNREKTYSAPLAVRQFTKETELIDGEAVRDFPRLIYAGTLLERESDHHADVRQRTLKGVLYGLAVTIFLALLLTVAHWGRQRSLSQAWRQWWHGLGVVPWRPVWITLGVLAVTVCTVLTLSVNY